MSGPLLDQLLAATSETEHNLRRAASRLNARVQVATDPAWDAFIGRLLPDGHPTWACIHASEGPRPMFVLAALPGLALCASCVLTAAADTDDGYAATTDCDACGRDSTTFHEVMVSIGPVTLVGNMCPRCFGRAKQFHGDPEVTP